MTRATVCIQSPGRRTSALRHTLCTGCCTRLVKCYGCTMCPAVVAFPSCPYHHCRIGYCYRALAQQGDRSNYSTDPSPYRRAGSGPWYPESYPTMAYEAASPRGLFHQGSSTSRIARTEAPSSEVLRTEALLRIEVLRTLAAAELGIAHKVAAAWVVVYILCCCCENHGS